MSQTNWEQVRQIAAAIVLPNIGGWAGSLISANSINTWYRELENILLEHALTNFMTWNSCERYRVLDLKKPSFTPPNWLFRPAWTFLYCSMGYASYRVVSAAGSLSAAAFPLSMYAANLSLNWSWTPIFFGSHKLGLSLPSPFIVVTGCPATRHLAILLGLSFGAVDAVAGWLIAPYACWLTLATLLNHSIWKLNPTVEDGSQKTG